jgi:uncharacterized membrane protein (DUF485 family)
MIHEPAIQKETDHAAVKKASLGVKLFTVYTIIYSGFVLIGLTKPELMGLELIDEQNVAIIYGFGLIVLAIVMGFVYNYFCTKMENQLNNIKVKK